jgi:hypothetical protein
MYSWSLPLFKTTVSSADILGVLTSDDDHASKTPASHSSRRLGNLGPFRSIFGLEDGDGPGYRRVLFGKKTSYSLLQAALSSI